MKASSKVSEPKIGRYRLSNGNSEYSFMGHTIEIRPDFSVNTMLFTLSEEEHGQHESARSSSAYGKLRKVGSGWKMELMNERENACILEVTFTENALRVQTSYNECDVLGEDAYIYV